MGEPKIQKTLARAIAGAAVAVLITMSAAPADAAEVRLLSAAAMQSVFKEIAGDFERTAGHKLIISYATIGGVAQRVEAGEAADVVIGSTLIMPALVKAGRIDPLSQVTVCTSGIGLVVPSGTPVPRLASVADFIRAALDAKVVIHADPVRGGAAGVHIARVFEKLGIAGKLNSQITLAAGGDVTEVTLAQGSGALGMTQISEIVGKPGAEYVGPLPDELQNYTVFVAAVPAGDKSSDAARAFITFLQSPTALAAIKAKGMRPE